MAFLSSLILYGTLFFAGFVWAGVLGVKNKIEKTGIGFLLSTYFVTYVSFLLYRYAQVRYTLQNTIILYLGVMLVTVLFTRIFKSSGLPKISLKTTDLEKIFKNERTISLLCLICIPIGFAFLQNIHWPVVDWDAIALYDYRAKVFVITGGMEDGIKRGYFLHYPLYTSLLHTYTYLFGMQSVRLWYSFLYISAAFVFYSLLRRKVSRNRALLGVILFVISPRIFQHAQMTYTNFPHAVYLSLGYIYLWEWLRLGKISDLYIAGLVIAGSMWVRLTEPLWIPSIALIILGLVKRPSQWKECVFVVASLFALRHPWTSFVEVQDKLNISNPLQIGNGLQLPSNPFTYVSRFVEVISFFKISVYPLFSEYVPALFLASMFALYHEKWDEVFEYISFLGLVVFIFIGVFIFSFQFKGWQEIPDSAARMAMFLIPIATYLIAKSDLWILPKRKQR